MFSLNVFRRLELHHDLPDVSDRRGVADHGRLHHDRHRGPLLLHVSRFCRFLCRDGREKAAMAESSSIHCVSLGETCPLNVNILFIYNWRYTRIKNYFMISEKTFVCIYWSEAGAWLYCSPPQPRYPALVPLHQPLDHRGLRGRGGDRISLRHSDGREKVSLKIKQIQIIMITWENPIKVFLLIKQIADAAVVGSFVHFIQLLKIFPILSPRPVKSSFLISRL